MDRKGQELARRSVLTHIGAGAAIAGAVAAASTTAKAQNAGAGFQPAMHPQDAWLDELPGRHRFVLDTTTAEAAGGAFLYAGNFFIANKNGYDLDPPDLAVVVILRHFSTPFAYTDAIWAKYGAAFSGMLSFNDPKTSEPLNFNVYNSGDYGMTLPNFGTTLPSLIERGVHFAVCDMATHFIAGQLAMDGGDADAIYAELAGSLIPNAHMVPAGIVAVNRAQEHGYTFAYVG
jgi:hypothetical protein